MMSAPARLEIDRTFRDDAALIVPRGVLDLASYSQLREALLESVLEIPRAVVVDLDALLVPTPATLAVFSSVWMQVSDWPGVPIVLVASRPLDRRRFRRSPVFRYVQVYASLDEALGALHEPPPRRRTLLELPCGPVSPATARRFVAVTCTRWGCTDLLLDAELIASELVENAVRHARSESRLRLELRGGMLTVAVYDNDPTLAGLVEPDLSGTPRLGLLLVAQLATTWNCAPVLAGGKVVWAVLRKSRLVPDDRPRRRTRRVIFGG